MSREDVLESVRDMALGEAWREAEASLPEGWALMVGQVDQCAFCPGYWATARIGGNYPDGRHRLIIVSSEDGRPRGEHHDPTPAAALRELAAKLRARPTPEAASQDWRISRRDRPL